MSTQFNVTSIVQTLNLLEQEDVTSVVFPMKQGVSVASAQRSITAAITRSKIKHLKTVIRKSWTVYDNTVVNVIVVSKVVCND